MKRRASSDRFAGFTVPELLAVTAVIAIIVSMLLPSLGKAREEALMTKCQNVMRQTSIANRSYAFENRNWYVFNTYGGSKHNGVNYTRYWSTDPGFLSHVGLTVEQVSNKWKTNDGTYGAGFAAGCQWPDSFDCPSQGKPKYWLQNDYWGHEIGISYNREQHGQSQRTISVQRASSKFQFADGDNWWMNSKFSDYKIYSDLGIIDHGGWGGLLPRHIGETANVAFYDCHVERLKKEETYFYGSGAGNLIKERWDLTY